MKCIVSVNTFVDRLVLVSRVSGKHVTLPVLQGVQIEAKQGRVYLRATNLDIGIEATVPAKIEEEGVAVVSSSVFVSVLQSYGKSGSVTLSVTDGAMVLTGARGTTKLACLDHTEFPALPRVVEGQESTIEARDLAVGIRSVWFAASNSSIKPELASVYLYEDSGSMVFVGTDSFRLAEKRVRPKSPVSLDPLLVPIRTALDLVKVLEVCEGPVSLRFSANQLSCTFDGIYVTTRLVDGSFPDYRQIIPSEVTTKAVFLKQDIVAAIKKAAIFSDRFNQVTFALTPSDGTVTLQAVSAEVGEMNDALEGEFEGADLTISFNQRYLMDSFQSIDAESVSLSFSGPGRPMVLRGVGDESFLYLVMPMNK